MASDVARQQNDVSLWRRAAIDAFRESAGESSKRRQRRLRAKAADYLALLEATAEEQRLLRLYGGLDDSSPEYISRAAERVGLAVPQQQRKQSDGPVIVDTRTWGDSK